MSNSRETGLDTTPFWHLIFCSHGSIEVQCFKVRSNDPQSTAAALKDEHEWLDGFYLVAAVKGAEQILVADNARTGECQLQ